MKYVGSKNRLAKELVPIIQSFINEDTRGYLEPFVGGANMIDKIECFNKIGCDIHEELIELLKHVQNLENELPQHISEEHYTYVKANRNEFDKWYQGLVGFTASFSARYFNTYARSFKADGITRRDMSNEGIRNIERQRPNLVDITFNHTNFLKLDPELIHNFVIYCDIPYCGTDKYYIENKNGFPYIEFYDWCEKSSVNNTVLISEYNMPEDRFKCIWSKEHKVGNSPTHKEHKIRVEKLFVAGGNK
jgi:site-specific DNA-adenine methylase